MKVYLAGPYSGNLILKIYNIFTARKYAKYLIMMGMYPYTPHMNTVMMDKIAPYRFFMKMHTAYLDDCDVVLMLPGWKRSAGAVEEEKHATDNDIPIAHNMKELQEFIMDNNIDAP